jgi:hypothetical protein
MYEKFGFRVLEPESTPPYYRRLQRLAGIFLGMTGKRESLFVMKLG